MKNLLVTGGLGHIGSRLIRHLLDEGHEVHCIDNLSTQRFISLRGIIQNPNFTFYQFDLNKDSELIEKNFGSQKIDSVIHLSAITDAEGSHGKADEVHQNNFNSTKNIVQFCKNNSSKLIFPSSTSVYGTSESEVFEDDERFLNPQSPYAESKINEEIYIRENLDSGFNILRFGTIFGVSPGMRFHTAVNKFCWQAALRNPITVWQTALNQYRPYLEIKDACNAVSFFLNEEHDAEVFNILTENYTVKNIIETIQKYKEVDIQFVESKIMNQLSYFVKNDKINATGFNVSGNLDDAIRDTFNWLG
jgi:UDP-glucose 4-epimerase